MKKEEEIVAVIAAVLKQYSNRPEVKLKIKSIKRNGSHTSAWASAGRLARMDNRLNS